MASGVKASDEVKQAYTDMKMRHKYKWVLFKISDDEKLIVIDQVETDRNKRYEDFVELIINQPARYALVDVCYQRQDTGAVNEKMAFVAWCPEGCTVKERMVFASSKEDLRQHIGGLKDIQACSADELDYQEIVDKIR